MSCPPGGQQIERPRARATADGDTVVLRRDASPPCRVGWASSPKGESIIGIRGDDWGRTAGLEWKFMADHRTTVMSCVYTQSHHPRRSALRLFTQMGPLAGSVSGALRRARHRTYTRSPAVGTQIRTWERCSDGRLSGSFRPPKPKGVALLAPEAQERGWGPRALVTDAEPPAANRNGPPAPPGCCSPAAATATA